MSIDLGNNPVGTPPTTAQQTQMRAALGINAQSTAGIINTATEDAAILDADQIPLTETAAGGAFRRATFATVWNWITGKLAALTSLTVGGAWNFSSTTRPTSSGTGMPAANSLMTRTDVGIESFFNLGQVSRPPTTPAFSTNGTGAAASNIAGDRWINLASGTANSGWARAQIARGLTTLPSFSGSGINFGRSIGVAIFGFVPSNGFTDVGSIFRLRVGADSTPTPDGTDPVSYRGFGIEFKARGSSHDWRIYAHNGTSITYSAWTNTGLLASLLSTPLYMSIISNGAGSVTGYLGSNGGRILSTLSITGGPTSGGAAAQSFVDVHVANSATGTSSLAAIVQDAMIYTL
jgi:hypothetical protein